jgi:hypothetical protein
MEKKLRENKRLSKKGQGAAESIHEKNSVASFSV